jgi:hypothetical protein
MHLHLYMDCQIFSMKVDILSPVYSYNLLKYRWERLWDPTDGFDRVCYSTCILHRAKKSHKYIYVDGVKILNLVLALVFAEGVFFHTDVQPPIVYKVMFV